MLLELEKEKEILIIVLSAQRAWSRGFNIVDAILDLLHDNGST